MKTPYYITNEVEYEKVLKPLLLEWGYTIPIRYIDWSKSNKLVLDECGDFGKVWVFANISANQGRYLELNIHKFLIGLSINKKHVIIFQQKNLLTFIKNI